MLGLTTVIGVARQPATAITVQNLLAYICTHKNKQAQSTVHVTRWSETASLTEVESEGDKDWVRQVYSGVILRRPRNFQQSDRKPLSNWQPNSSNASHAATLHTSVSLYTDTTLLSAIYSFIYHPASTGYTIEDMERKNRGLL